MATLDRWRSYLTVPKTIRFPHLELKGRDHSPPIVVGAGEVRVPSLMSFEFTLTGTPDDVGYAMNEFRRQRDNPYDGLARFRLTGTDSDGLAWTLGWTVPHIEPDHRGAWTFRGNLDGLLPHDDSPSVSGEPCTEVIYCLPVDHPMARTMNRFVNTDNAERDSPCQHALNILDSALQFSYEPKTGLLSITAPHSNDLPATYAENWLAEPLRILFGQLVFPRLVARNLGGGRALVFICETPAFVRDAAWAALWNSSEALVDKSTFWRIYAQLLMFVAHARDGNGDLNFEANKVTKLYEEIIQATHGSRWVWALTLASAIEGLTNMLIPKGQRRSDVDEEGIEDLVGHISSWSGTVSIKQVALNAVHRSARVTPVHTMRQLEKASVITAEQVSAWQEIRNSVMHGSLISPYSSEEEDNKILALATMMHSITRAIVSRGNDIEPSPNFVAPGH